MKEYEISIILSEEEEKQLQELTELYQLYEIQTSGKAKSSKENVLGFVVWLGLSGHIQENLDYLRNQLKQSA